MPGSALIRGRWVVRPRYTRGGMAFFSVGARVDWSNGDAFAPVRMSASTRRDRPNDVTVFLERIRAVVAARARGEAGLRWL